MNILKVPTNRTVSHRAHLGFGHTVDKMAGRAGPQKMHGPQN